MIAEKLEQQIACLDKLFARKNGDLEDFGPVILNGMRAEADGAGLVIRRKELADAVATYATLNRASLFPERKSLELAFGIMGFRQSTQIAQQKITRSL